jgi:hypothetical protein
MLAVADEQPAVSSWLETAKKSPPDASPPSFGLFDDDTAAAERTPFTQGSENRKE